MPTMTKAGYTPQQQKKPKKTVQKVKKQKKKRRRLNTAGVVSLLIFLIAALIGVATLYVYAQTAPYTDTFLPGTLLGGVSLDGAEFADAQALLARMTDETVASWTFRVSWRDNTYTLTAQDVGLAVDAQATLEPLFDIGRDGNMFARFMAIAKSRRSPTAARPVIVYTMDAVDALLERVKADIECAPVDADVTFIPNNSEPFRFTQEEPGYALDTAKARAAIKQALDALQPGEFELEVKTLEPSVTKAALSDALSLRARVVMKLSDDEDAAHNAALAAEALAGARVDAGKRLSFNETVGKREAEAGYRDAREEAYGQNVFGIGGGVCQMATAVYQAALLGGLPVAERNAAVYPTSYSEVGQEAAVSDQGLDLVIQNDTDMPLFLTARVYRDGEAYFAEVRLIGCPLSEKYRLETQTEETPAPETPIYVRDSEGRYAQYSDERIPMGSALPGYRARVERVTVDANGEAVSRELISEETYEAAAQLIYVGVQQREK